MIEIGSSDIQFGVVSIEGAASNSEHFLVSYFAHLNFSNKNMKCGRIYKIADLKHK